MKPMIVSLVALAMALSIAVLSAGAQFNVGFMGGPVSQGVPYVFTCGPCGFTTAMPFAQSSYIMQAFNTSTLARTDAEAFAFSFPGFGSTGPGSLSAPGSTLAQTASDSVFASRSYFFDDFITG